MALMRRLAVRRRVTLMLALAVLLMLLRGLRRRGLGDGGGGDHERDRGQKDFHFLAPFGFEWMFEVVRRIAEVAARPPAERRRSGTSVSQMAPLRPPAVGLERGPRRAP
jgi:hypothetical protein